MESADPSDFDLHLFSEGRHWHIYNVLGAHPCRRAGEEGVRFAVWAPEARGVSVAGGFNDWQAGEHPMTCHGGYGVWSCFVPGIGPGSLYKFAITTASGEQLLKTDPYGQLFELRPATAAVVTCRGGYEWPDGDWLGGRGPPEAGG
ncbi:MAG TPA: 1,4-alpha-glucan branching enzyme, partial [Marinobacter sp.]|nr:1,4-alpha-glucan branching enzyme [Marinobacter sp.]